jgi:hypothetical protein
MFLNKNLICIIFEKIMYKRFQFTGCILFIFIIFLSTTPSKAQWSIDAESGIAFLGYNDIRIPNETGTLFSFKNDFDVQGTVIPIRIRVGYTWNERNHLFGLIAPLFVNYTGTPSEAIDFQSSTFNAGETLQGFYQFNSYRLTYRRDFLVNGPWTLGVGFTAKIRDASVQLDNELGNADRKDDVGFVPLLHLYTEYALENRTRFYLEGDGLAGGPGRAFDVFLGTRIPLTAKTDFKAGYRILEGGANVEEVYNFTLVQFAVFGLFFQL